MTGDKVDRLLHAGDGFGRLGATAGVMATGGSLISGTGGVGVGAGGPPKPTPAVGAKPPGNPGCFLAGTFVLSCDSQNKLPVCQAIESIKIGDFFWSFDVVSKSWQRTLPDLWTYRFLALPGVSAAAGHGTQEDRSGRRIRPGRRGR